VTVGAGVMVGFGVSVELGAGVAVETTVADGAAASDDTLLLSAPWVAIPDNGMARAAHTAPTIAPPVKSTQPLPWNRLQPETAGSLGLPKR